MANQFQHLSEAAKLYQDGLLSEEEFQTVKKRLIEGDSEWSESDRASTNTTSGVTRLDALTFGRPNVCIPLQPIWHKRTGRSLGAITLLLSVCLYCSSLAFTGMLIGAIQESENVAAGRKLMRGASRSEASNIGRAIRDAANQSLSDGELAFIILFPGVVTIIGLLLMKGVAGARRRRWQLEVKSWEDKVLQLMPKTSQSSSLVAVMPQPGRSKEPLQLMRKNKVIHSAPEQHGLVYVVDGQTDDLVLKIAQSTEATRIATNVTAAIYMRETTRTGWRQILSGAELNALQRTSDDSPPNIPTPDSDSTSAEVRISCPAYWMAFDVGIFLTINEGAQIRVGSIKKGIDHVIELEVGEHELEFVFGKYRGRTYLVRIPKLGIYHLSFEYSRMWGNFTKEFEMK